MNYSGYFVDSEGNEYYPESKQKIQWITCDLNAGFTHGALASSGNLMYGKLNGIVYLKGSCKGFRSGNTVCTQLPERF